ncbi:MAG: hypothetical protein ACTTKC_02550 [Treponema sp.]|uniref:hypothetical protein n=1 Tax=Treponema sp. TaxID=166 RepID=UPI003FA2E399
MKKCIFFCALLCCLYIKPAAQTSFFDDAGTEDDTGNTFDFSSDSSASSENARTFEFSGFASTQMRMYPHKDLKRTDALPVFGINLKYNAPNTELDAHFKCNALTIADYPLDLIDECTVRAYIGDFVLSAGKMKIVWGRGDMLHVLDVFNANDFTDFTIPAYINRRIAEPMVHLAYNAPIPLRVEAVWTPLMTPDRIALKGPWEPTQIKDIKQKTIDFMKSDRLANAFPMEKVESIMYSTIKDSLTTATASPATVTTNFPELSDVEINEIVNKRPLIERPAVRATLMALSGKPITFDISGVLTPNKIDKIAKDESKKYTKLVREEFEKQISRGAKIIEDFRFDECVKIGMNAFMPDMNQIKYGQYGLRLSGSAGPVDMAGQYYYGRYKTPSVNTEKLISEAMAGGNIRDCVYYDPVHIFGADLAAAIAMFNFKSEAAYYMTYDFKGTDPAVHNNSVQWLLGFDVDIPLNNINLNVQNIGSYIIGFKNVKQNNADGKFDMDWNAAEKPTNNKIVCNISDSWLHETLTDSLTVIWGIEHNDAVIMPRIKYKIKDEFYIEGMGAYIYAKDKKSEFSAWKNNHFVQVSFEYKF